MFQFFPKAHDAQFEVYEWLITLDMEVQYVWGSRWNLTKVVYLINRYLVIVDFVINYFRGSTNTSLPACMVDMWEPVLMCIVLQVPMVCVFQHASRYFKPPQVRKGHVWPIGPDPEQPFAAIYTFALYAAECKYSVHANGL